MDTMIQNDGHHCHSVNAAQSVKNTNEKYSFFSFIVWVLKNVKSIVGFFSSRKTKMPDIKMNNRYIKVVFVGAGPVGLWTAIQTKLNNSKANVTMYDKRNAYDRNHTVRIDKHCFSSGIMKAEGNDTVEALKKLQDDINETKGYIRCDELEKRLKTIALNMRISVNSGEEVTAISSNKVFLGDDKEDSYGILVGADGAHSKIRKAMPKLESDEKVYFNALSPSDENDEFTNGMKRIYRVRVKYKVDESLCKKMNSDTRSWLKLVYPAIKPINSFVAEHVQRCPDGGAYINIDFFISDKKEIDFFYDKTETNSMEQPRRYNFKTPATLNELPQTLKEKILTWVGVRCQYLQDKTPQLDSFSIAPYYLGHYRAKEMSLITSENTAVLLTGDAAIGLPFMRSLNNGLHLGSNMGYQLANLENTTLQNVVSSIDIYQKIRYVKESFVSSLKRRVVSAALALINVSNRVPWQVNKFSNTQLANMRAATGLTTDTL
ncbi:MAG: hypothetical protein KAG53_06955 [Endozoicomonadaceae bacterium]|nr:hypothetical protein [Endozoicomonadaceae bacterium]